MQKLTDDLVEKFLSGNCTKEEVAIVWNYLRNNPDEHYLLDEYQQTDGDAVLPSGYKEEMLAFITERTGHAAGTEFGTGADREKMTDGGVMTVGGTMADGGTMMAPEVDYPGPDSKGRRLRTILTWAAAASVILIFKAWFSLQPAIKASGENLMAYNATGTGWIEKSNTGKKDILLILPDSSKVRMSPGAHMRYRKDFGRSAQRDVQITGKAYFDVAKNQKMPFTLYSEGLQTRVLGTTFDVNANPFSDKIKIKLLTGKVLVSLDSTSSLNEQKIYYLSPGQELVFSRSTHNVAINDPEKHTEDRALKAHPVKVDTISNWYMFNNQTLAEVFDQLSAIYNVNIEYSREDIRNMYFIGKLEKKDSLSEIINDIALLNHLSVTNLNGRYIIRKGKP